MSTAMPPSRIFRLLVTLSVVAGVALGTSALVGSIGSSAHLPAAPGFHASSAVAKGLPLLSKSEPASTPASGPSEPAAGQYKFGVVATVGLGDGTDPVGVAYDTANGTAYVTSPHTDNVSVISGTTQLLVRSIALNESPAGIAYDSVNSAMYVGSFFGTVVKVINTTTNSVVANISVPGEPIGLGCACSPTLDEVFVAQQGQNQVSVISGATNQVTDIVPVGQYPMAVAFDSANEDVYVANFGSDNVTIINATNNEVTGSVPVGAEPEGVTYDSANGDIYVSNSQSNYVSVISGASEVASVQVGPYPVGITYNAAFSLIAVVSNAGDEVNFIATSNDTVVGSVAVGHLPVGIAYNPTNHYEYVANSNTSNVSVIGTALHPPYAVTFTESGLVAGTNWSVTLGTTESYSKTMVVSFSELNATYAFQITPVAGYTVSPSTGSLTVAGFPVNELVTFTPVYYGVTFTETGLASGTHWTVFFSGFEANSTNSTVLFSVVNGSYPYTVSNITGYSVSPTAGTVLVAGASQIVSVTFSTGASHSSSSTIAGFPIWVIIVIVVAVVAVIIGVLLLRRRRPPPSPATAASPGGTPPSSSPATNPPGPR